MAIKKKTLGRQKIEIKKLEKKSSMQVTFSKRRTGLFKKAGELSVLCGAEIAIIVFSPNKKIFCFGHPNVESVLDRFFTRNSSPPNMAESIVPVAEFNRDFAYASMQLEMEKSRAVEVKEVAEMGRNNGRFWWEEPMENKGVEDLKQYRWALQDLRVKVAERIEKITAARMGVPLLPPLPLASSYHLSGNHSVMTGVTKYELGFY